MLFLVPGIELKQVRETRETTELCGRTEVLSFDRSNCLLIDRYMLFQKLFSREKHANQQNHIEINVEIINFQWKLSFSEDQKCLD